METIKKLTLLFAIVLLAACQKDEFVIQDESNHQNGPVFRSSPNSKGTGSSHGNLIDNSADVEVTDPDNTDEDGDGDVTDSDGTEEDGDGE